MAAPLTREQIVSALGGGRVSPPALDLASLLPAPSNTVAALPKPSTDIEFLGPLGDFIDAIDTPRAMAASAIKEFGDLAQGRGFSLRDWWKQTGDNIFMQDVMRDLGADMGGVKGFFLGLGMDIALDPITYALGPVGAAARAGMSAPKLIHALGAGAKYYDDIAKGVTTVAGISTSTATRKAAVLQEAVVKVGKTNAMSSAGREALKEVGLLGEMGLSVPGTGRLGRWLGVDRALDLLSGGRVTAARAAQAARLPYIDELARPVSEAALRDAQAAVARFGPGAVEDAAAAAPRIEQIARDLVAGVDVGEDILGDYLVAAARVANRMPVEAVSLPQVFGNFLYVTMPAYGAAKHSVMTRKGIEAIDTAFNSKASIRDGLRSGDYEMVLNANNVLVKNNRGWRMRNRFMDLMSTDAVQLRRIARDLNLAPEVVDEMWRTERFLMEPLTGVPILDDAGKLQRNPEFEKLFAGPIGIHGDKAITDFWFDGRGWMDDALRHANQLGGGAPWLMKHVDDLWVMRLAVEGHYSPTAARKLRPGQRYRGVLLQSQTEHAEGWTIDKQVRQILQDQLGDDAEELFDRDIWKAMNRYMNMVGEEVRRQAVMNGLAEEGVMFKNPMAWSKSEVKDLSAKLRVAYGERERTFDRVFRSIEGGLDPEQVKAVRMAAAEADGATAAEAQMAAVAGEADLLEGRLIEIHQKLRELVSGVRGRREDVAKFMEPLVQEAATLGYRRIQLERTLRALQSVRTQQGGSAVGDEILAGLEETLEQARAHLAVAMEEAKTVALHDQSVDAAQKVIDVLTGDLAKLDLDLFPSELRGWAEGVADLRAAMEEVPYELFDPLSFDKLPRWMGEVQEDLDAAHGAYRDAVRRQGLEADALAEPTAREIAFGGARAPGGRLAEVVEINGRPPDGPPGGVGPSGAPGGAPVGPSLDDGGVSVQRAGGGAETVMDPETGVWSDGSVYDPGLVASMEVQPGRRKVIAACTGMKCTVEEGASVAAKDLYTGPSFVVLRGVVSETDVELAGVLSGRYGVLDPLQRVGTYDQPLAESAAEAAEVFAGPHLLRKFAALVGEGGVPEELYVYGSRAYREQVRRLIVRAQKRGIWNDGVNVVYGKGRQGEQMRHLRSWAESVPDSLRGVDPFANAEPIVSVGQDLAGKGYTLTGERLGHITKYKDDVGSEVRVVAGERGKTLYLMGLEVPEAHRGQGRARRLVEHIMKVAEKTDEPFAPAGVYLHASDELVEMYKGMGFQTAPLDEPGWWLEPSLNLMVRPIRGRRPVGLFSIGDEGSTVSEIVPKRAPRRRSPKVFVDEGRFTVPEGTLEVEAYLRIDELLEQLDEGLVAAGRVADDGTVNWKDLPPELQKLLDEADALNDFVGGAGGAIGQLGPKSARGGGGGIVEVDLAKAEEMFGGGTASVTPLRAAADAVTAADAVKLKWSAPKSDAFIRDTVVSYPKYPIPDEGQIEAGLETTLEGIRKTVRSDRVLAAVEDMVAKFAKAEGMSAKQRNALRSEVNAEHVASGKAYRKRARFPSPRVHTAVVQGGSGPDGRRLMDIWGIEQDQRTKKWVVSLNGVDQGEASSLKAAKVQAQQFADLWQSRRGERRLPDLNELSGGGRGPEVPPSATPPRDLVPPIGEVPAAGAARETGETVADVAAQPAWAEAGATAEDAAQGGSFFHYSKDPSLSIGEPRDYGGFHAGSWKAATERGGLASQPEQGFVHSVQIRPKKPYMPNGAMFDERAGRSRTELWTLVHSSDKLAQLRAQGYDVIPYINGTEAPGSLAYLILDPASVTVGSSTRVRKVGESFVERGASRRNLEEVGVAAGGVARETGEAAVRGGGISSEWKTHRTLMLPARSSIRESVVSLLGGMDGVTIQPGSVKITAKTESQVQKIRTALARMLDHPTLEKKDRPKVEKLLDQMQESFPAGASPPKVEPFEIRPPSTPPKPSPGYGGTKSVVIRTPFGDFKLETVGRARSKLTVTASPAGVIKGPRNLLVGKGATASNVDEALKKIERWATEINLRRRTPLSAMRNAAQDPAVRHAIAQIAGATEVTEFRGFKGQVWETGSPMTQVEADVLHQSAALYELAEADALYMLAGRALSDGLEDDAVIFGMLARRRQISHELHRMTETSYPQDAATEFQKALRAFDNRRTRDGYQSAMTEAYADQWGPNSELRRWSTGWSAPGDADQRAAMFHMLNSLFDVQRTSGGFSGFFKWYDQFLNYWKAQAVATPGFVLRNGFGGSWMSYAFGGMELGATNKFAGTYFKAIKRGGEAGYLAGMDLLIEDLARSPKSTLRVGFGAKVDINELRQIKRVLDSGITGGGQVITEVERAVATRLVKETKMPITGNPVDIVFNPFSTEFAPFRAVRSANEQMETVLRGSLAFDVLQKGGSLDEAAGAVYKLQFNYADLTPTERKARRVIPFWTWQKNVVPVLVESLGKHPRAWGRLQQLKGNMESSSEQKGVVPDYFLENMGIRLPWKINDYQTYWIPDLPFRDLNRLVKEPTSITRVFAESAAPPVRLPLEIWAKKQFFADLPFSGRYQQVPPVYARVPFLMEALASIGKAKKNKSGTWKMRDHDIYQMDGWMPFMARFRRLLPNESRYSRRVASTTVSVVFGTQVRVVDPRETRNQLLRDDKAFNEKMRDLIDIELRLR